MKINTDGVLLGALAEAETPKRILDIGTGTGVIALMLAQRFADAKIDAVEIDGQTAETANNNFRRSIFSDRLTAYPTGFEEFFDTYPEKKYNLIVSNPPFYINSLQSPVEKKQLAKHADEDFFKLMLSGVVSHMSANGTCWLVLPINTACLVKTIASELGLNVINIFHISSFKEKAPHREIMVLSKKAEHCNEQGFVIYEAEGVHSAQYRNVLKEFFTIF